jgi:hypothetical protein
VLSSGTYHQFEKKPNNREVWDTPPEVVPLFQVPLTIQALFGTRKGSLVAVGYLGKGARSHRLLVRCDCGRYEVRVVHRWKKLRDVNNYCQFCDQREKLKMAHLPDAEKDRLKRLARERAGLPSEAEIQAAANQRRKAQTEQVLAGLLKRR